MPNLTVPAAMARESLDAKHLYIQLRLFLLSRPLFAHPILHLYNNWELITEFVCNIRCLLVCVAK